MPTDKLNPEVKRMVDNIETFKRLISAKCEKRSEELLYIVSSIEERLIETPSSSKTDYHGCFPGGLIDHSLRVVKFMSELNKIYEANLSSDSIVLTGLFHDIGKIGDFKDPSKNYYIRKNSDWHNKQGILYDINPEFSGISVSLRSLCILQEAQVQLTSEEFLAIASIKDRHRSSDDSLPLYQNEGILTLILSQAVKVSCLKGQGKTSILQ